MYDEEIYIKPGEYTSLMETHTNTLHQLSSCHYWSKMVDIMVYFAERAHPAGLFGTDGLVRGIKSIAPHLNIETLYEFSTRYLYHAEAFNDVLLDELIVILQRVINNTVSRHPNTMSHEDVRQALKNEPALIAIVMVATFPKITQEIIKKYSTQ